MQIRQLLPCLQWLKTYDKPALMGDLLAAVIGTIMVGNVFLGIVPAQRALVNAVARGEKPGEEVVMLAQRAMLRSRHNNYLTLPVLFIMISNHYPMLYGHPEGWAILAAIGFITAFARHYFNLKHRGIHKPGILVLSALLTLALVWALAPDNRNSDAAVERVVATDTEVSGLLRQHCTACHAREPEHAQVAEPCRHPLESVGIRAEKCAYTSLSRRNPSRIGPPGLTNMETSSALMQCFLNWKESTV